MKRSILFILVITFHCLGIAKYVRAEEPKKLAQATMTFLNIEVGARAVGMGGSFICMDNDATSLFWNPAGIANISGTAISLNYNQWIAEMKQSALAVTYGNPMLGTFGLSFKNMDNGDLERTIPANNDEGYLQVGTFNVNQFVAGIAYGRQITERFLIGGQVKYAYQDLGPSDILIQTIEESDTLLNKENKEGTFALDFGTIYYTGFKDLRLAMSFRNFASSIKYAYESYELPISFKVGVAMNVLSLVDPDAEFHSLQLAIDAVHSRDYTERIHLGAEYWFRDLLAIRSGYKFNYDEESFSAGFGLKSSFIGINLKIDYAYSAFGDFNSAQRFSVAFLF